MKQSEAFSAIVETLDVLSGIIEDMEPCKDEQDREVAKRIDEVEHRVRADYVQFKAELRDLVRKCTRISSGLGEVDKELSRLRSAIELLTATKEQSCDKPSRRFFSGWQQT